jgi:hypothetical protein
MPVAYYFDIPIESSLFEIGVKILSLGFSLIEPALGFSSLVALATLLLTIVLECTRSMFT